ncbi:MAG: transglutaminase family protein [Prochlorococcaceae cyanobacterium]
MSGSSPTLEATARAVEERLVRSGIALTMGGEPTFVPVNPEGAEWSVAADGPTKLAYARALAVELQNRVWPGCTILFCPGKRYDGEVNPRWALRLITKADGSPLVPWPDVPKQGVCAPPEPEAIEALLSGLGLCLGAALHPVELSDPQDPQRRVWAVPLAWDQERWHTIAWTLAPALRQLNGATGPAGLRLPLEHFPSGVLKQVLTIEVHASGWGLFLPPVPRQPFEQLLQAIAASSSSLAPPELSGVVPLDLDGRWQVLGLTADPGVLEVNLPVCSTWQHYADWLQALEDAAAQVGLRSFKQQADRSSGTGGGNHLLLGGPELSRHPLFARPAWLVAILRYWQHHPSLAYLFSGNSVGPASQAPRCDEGSTSLLDLELAHRLLEQLREGDDHRVAIGETLRHLHADRSGNTHRSEISLDKFWNPAWSAGCQGLLEFRAIESMPDHRWSAAVALLVRALVVMLLDPARRPSALQPWGDTLHDQVLLPSQLWADLQLVLADLEAAALPLPNEVFQAIWQWRFPLLLQWQSHNVGLEIREALEPWPLLCDVPVEGGSTSRFVDSSLRRFEVMLHSPFSKDYQLKIDGRPLPLAAGVGQPIAVRYRQEALYPCLHPLMPVHVPLRLDLVAQADGLAVASWILEDPASGFCSVEPVSAGPSHPAAATLPLRPAAPGLCTMDLRF